MPVDEWPHDFESQSMDGNNLRQIRFRPVQVTVARVAPWGDLEFEEDTDRKPGTDYRFGWKPLGLWDESINRRAPYAGKPFTAGMRIEAYLTIREYINKDGAKATARDIVPKKDGTFTILSESARSEAEGSQTPSAVSSGSPATSDAIQERVSRGQALNLRAQLFGSLVQATDKRLDAIGVTTDQLQEMLGTLNMAISVLDSGRQPTEDELYGPKESQDTPEEGVSEEPEEEPWGAE